MADPRYLADTSVWNRIDLDEVNDRIEPLILAGKLRTCRMVDLEVVYGSHTRQVNAMVAQRSRLPEAPITPAVTDRALGVAQLLAGVGLHRGAKATDLVIAAAAEAAGLVVLHYDVDFDRIASVTHQPTEWVAPAGSLAH